jgi:hypothetical protein
VRRSSSSRASREGPVGAIILGLLAGIAVAFYSAFVLGDSAWLAYTRCNPTPPGAQCTFHAFWGFDPTLFLAAAVAGLAIGVVLLVLTYLLNVYPRRHRLLGLLILVGAFASLIAYGGAIVGTILGLGSGVLALRFRPRGADSVSEWSGAYPAGAPPPQSPPKALVDRRPVTRWDEPMINPRSVPPSAARPEPSPRIARSSPPASAQPSAAGPAPSAVSRPPLTVIATPSRIGPLRNFNVASTRRPLDVARATTEATRSSVPGRGATTPTGATLAETGPATLPDREAEIPAPSLSVTADAASRPVLPSARAALRDSVQTAPAPIVQSPSPPRRVQAWTCSKCRLVNAPWSEACTRCHTLAPPFH